MRWLKRLVPSRVQTAKKTTSSHNWLLEVLELRAVPAVYTVTNDNDAGAGSLRQAIVDANAASGKDTIRFRFGDGPITLRPRSPLPTITDSVLMDGTTQGGYAGKPIVVLDGTQAGAGTNGLVFTAGGNAVRGLVINGFGGDGVQLNGGSGSTLLGNYIGTDLDGTTARPNGGAGVRITNSSNNRLGGAEQGTSLVKDIAPGPTNTLGSQLTSRPNLLTALGDKLFFSATTINRNNVTDNALWLTDGTADGTRVVSDIQLSSNFIASNDDNISEMVAFNGKVFYPAYDSAHNYRLWSSDGVTTQALDPAGAQPGTFNSGLRPQGLTVVGNKLFFFGYTSANQFALWVSDGTSGGTTAVKSFTLANNVNYLAEDYHPVAMGNKVVFAAKDAGGLELWSSDGTAAGTARVKDIVPGSADSFPQYLVSTGSRVFFVAASGSAARLWVSDGTDTGTVVVSTDINYATFSSAYKDPKVTLVGTAAYFVGQGPGDSRNRVWSVSTGGGAAQKITLPTQAASDTDQLVAYQGTLFFTYDKKLWKVQGSNAILVKDLGTGFNTAIGSPINKSTKVVGDTLYFLAQDPGDLAITGGALNELWKTDGTAAGTGVVRELAHGVGSIADADPSSLTAFQDRIFYTANDPATGYELWRSDGSAIFGGNVIAFNGGPGVAVISGTGNTITRNSIDRNGGLGIDLGGDGVTPNDPSDADTGPNNLQNFPVLLAKQDGPDTHVLGTAPGAAGQKFTLEFFASFTPDASGNGEGARYLGTFTNVDGGSSFNFAVGTTSPAEYVSATATDAAGNTSEFSLAIIHDTTGPTVTSITRADPNPTRAATVNFTVRFSKQVTSVNAADFAVVAAGLTNARVTAVSPTSGFATEFTVTVAADGGLGTLRLDVPVTATVQDLSGNALDRLPYSGGETYTIDRVPPTSDPPAPLDPNPTRAATVGFRVHFSEKALGVDVTDFAVSAVGLTNASISSVTPIGTAGQDYLVTVNTGSGDGSLRLDVASSPTITDALGNAMTQGVTGLTYTIDRTGPTVVSITRADPNPTSAAMVRYTVRFSEPTAGLDAADFAVFAPSLSNAAVTAVSPTSGLTTEFTVTVNTGSGEGELRLDLAASATVEDAVGNPYVGGLVNGEVYLLDHTAPTLTITAGTPTSRSPKTVPLTVVFSEPVTGFAASRLVTINATVAGFTAISATEYRFNLVAKRQAAMLLTVPAGAAADLAELPNAAGSRRFSLTADVAGRNQASGQWQVGKTTGTGFTFENWGGGWAANITWVDPQTGDFNGDGRADRAARNKATGDWRVALSNGSFFGGGAWGNWNRLVTWADVRAGDFNGDGRTDLAGRNKATGQWTVTLSLGNRFALPQVWTAWAANVAWANVSVGDFNGDGRDDLLARNPTTGVWWVSLSNGVSAFRPQQRWDTTWRAGAWDYVSVADFNGDGVSDVAGWDSQGKAWRVGISTTSAFSSSAWGNVALTEARAGDFDGDGKTDLAGRNSLKQWVLYRSTGTAFVAATPILFQPPTLVDLVVGDVNNDGKDDLIGRSTINGAWWVGLSDGTQLTFSVWAGPNSTRWGFVDVGNFA